MGRKSRARLAPPREETPLPPASPLSSLAPSQTREDGFLALARSRGVSDYGRVGEDRTGATGADRQRLTVPQAAEALGVTVDAVRGRIRRGKLQAEHEAGAVYVLIDAPDKDDRRGPSSTSQRRSDDQSERIEDLREQVDYLRDQLEQANERDRENRRIIAALTSRIPAIEAPESEDSLGPTDTPTGAARETQEGVQRPWWRRVFGG
jgi:hypothetical protein